MSKRIFDVAAATIGILILMPLLLVLYVLVRFKLGSPVLFWQVRAGFAGQPFTLVKFRTMTDGRDVNGQLLPDEQRLTRFGRFLRSTSMDELPELWNVLRGDMSLVGPRPLLMQYLERYTKNQFRRHETRPGLTGWAQVNGRNSLGWEERFELDKWYVDNRTFWLDLKIIWLTVFALIRRDGISPVGRETMEEFTGSESRT